MIFCRLFGKLIIPRKLNIVPKRDCIYFGKNAISIFAFLLGVKSLCGSKRSSTFFVRGFGCALFIYRGNKRMTDEKKLTGYPSIDKPWLKYYSEEAINAPLPEMTMFQYIWENNKEYLENTALRFFGKKYTYRGLFDRIITAAKAFYSMGVRTGDIVTIMSMHTPETIFAMYGLNYIGAVANMVYLTLSTEEIVHTVATTEPKLLLVLNSALEKVEAIKGSIPCPIVVLSIPDSLPAHMKLGYYLKAKPKKHSFLTWKHFLAKATKLAPMSTDHAAPAVIVYTSGTTGEPKGVVLSSDNINALAFQFLISGFKFGRGETFLDFIPTFLGYGIGMIATALGAGLDTTLWIILEPKAVSDAFERLKPNHIEIGVAFIDGILAENHSDMSQLINFAGGGGAISVEKEREVNRFLHEHHANTHFIMGYGMTEFASSVCNNLHNATKEGSIGVPFPKANVKVLDEKTNIEIGYGQIGEICFSAPNMMLEYFKNPTATNDIISVDAYGQRWLKTGDLGYIDEEGFVFFQGRIKRIYYTRLEDGTVMRLFPRRIEEFLESQSHVDMCGVVIKDHDTRIVVAIAFITLHNADSNDGIVEQLNILLKKELPSHMLPESIHILDKMPITSSGKIDYRALEEMVKEM